MSQFSNLELSMSPWTRVFFGSECYSLYADEVEKHVNAIKQSLNKAPIDSEHSTILSKLNDPLFWNEMRYRCGLAPEINTLELEWDAHALFANSSSQELLKLKDDHLDQLEMSLLRLLQELEANRDNHHLHGLWNPSWLIRWRDTAIQDAEYQLKECITLKAKFQKAVLSRLNLHKSFNVDRHYDDPAALITQNLRNLNYVGPDFQVPSFVQESLDDDTRVSFIDWFHAIFPESTHDSLKQYVKPIIQKTHEALTSASAIDEQNRKIALINSELRKKHGLSSVLNLKQNIEKKKSLNDWFQIKLSDITGLKIIPDRLIKAVNLLWWSRYILATLVSLNVYLALISVIAPIAVLSPLILNIASNVLFYTVGIFPVWWSLFEHGQTIYNSVLNIISNKKLSLINQSIEIIERNHKYITERLSDGIIDLPYFNTEILEASVKNRIIEIDNQIQTLTRKGVIERYLPNFILNDSIDIVVSELKVQKNLSIARMNQMARHIAERIGEELQLLERPDQVNNFSTRLSREKLLCLREFVTRNGSQEAIALFDKNSDVLGLLLTSITSAQLLHSEPQTQYANEPWGAHRINPSAISGWETLLKNYVLDDETRTSALKILRLLSGQEPMSIGELTSSILSIDPGSSASIWMEGIQSHLFSTLGTMPSDIVQSLSENQRKVIQEWAKDNSSNIHHAYEYYESIFEHESPKSLSSSPRISNETLARYFALLDGAARGRKIEGGDLCGNFQNKLRDAFESYNGEHDLIIHFIRFLPHHEKATILCEAAKKRLTYILDSFDKNIFSDSDIALFKNPYLSDEDSGFDFDSIVTSNKLFSASYKQGFSDLLYNFFKFELCSEDVLRRYKHEAVKTKKVIPEKFVPGWDYIANNRCAAESSELKANTHISRTPYVRA
jgi:hypothetical protein